VTTDDGTYEGTDRGPSNGESTPEYHHGTGEYFGPGGEDELPAAAATESPAEAYSPPEAKAPADADGREFWKPLGFDTHADYMRYLRRMQTLYEPLPKGTEPPTPRLAGAEIADVESAAAREMRTRQVNVKLRRSEGSDLDRAARIYGLAPSTLARLLVNRGVKAILDEY
jgi:hypothetical protein